MCFRVHTTLERFSLCERGNGGVYLQHTIAPGTANGGVCVRALRFRSLLVRLALDSLLHTLLTFIECMLIQSIRCQKNRPCVCVCVCGSMSLSLFLPQMEVCVHPHPRPRSSPPSHSLFPFFFPYTPLSLSLSMSYYHMSPTLLLLVSLILFPSAATEP